MSQSVSRRQEAVGTDRIDPRPDYFQLGIDAEGAHHCYRTLDETIFVITDGRIIHREDVATRSVDDWMAFVADRRGWTHKTYGLGIAGLIQRAFGGK